MTPGETAAAIAALAVGIYLIAASLGAVQLAVNQLVGLAIGVFGAAYILAGRTRESAFWGGVLAVASLVAFWRALGSSAEGVRRALEFYERARRLLT